MQHPQADLPRPVRRMTFGHRGGEPYACSLRTALDAGEVLDAIQGLPVEDIVVVERSPSYVVLSPLPKQRYGVQTAAALCAVTVLMVLVLTAYAVVWITALPLAILPFLPLILDDHPVLAVGAVFDDEGGTRVTVHGRAPERLTAAIDAYLVTLPAAVDTPNEAEALASV